MIYGSHSQKSTPLELFYMHKKSIATGQLTCFNPKRNWRNNNRSNKSSAFFMNIKKNKTKFNVKQPNKNTAIGSNKHYMMLNVSAYPKTSLRRWSKTDNIIYNHITPKTQGNSKQGWRSLFVALQLLSLWLIENRNEQ